MKCGDVNNKLWSAIECKQENKNKQNADEIENNLSFGRLEFQRWIMFHRNWSSERKMNGSLEKINFDINAIADVKVNNNNYRIAFRKWFLVLCSRFYWNKNRGKAKAQIMSEALESKSNDGQQHTHTHFSRHQPFENMAFGSDQSTINYWRRLNQWLLNGNQHMNGARWIIVPLYWASNGIKQYG